jgi:hypothetical protein
VTGKKANPASATKRRDAAEVTGGAAIALRIAASMGLLAGPKTKHFNVKVSPKLFAAAAQRVGTTSPAAVINAALAALATEDELGPWLAKNWGVLADTPPELLDQIDL